MNSEHPTAAPGSMASGRDVCRSAGPPSHLVTEAPPRGCATSGLHVMSAWIVSSTRAWEHDEHVAIAGAIPFSQRCLRRLPSLPFSRASLRFRLSRRRGSRRRKLTVGAVLASPDAEPTTLSRGEGVAGGSSSRGIDRDTVAPRRLECVGVDAGAVSWAGVDSDKDRCCSDEAACSVQAEIAMVCWGDRGPWEASGRSLGWIAMVQGSLGWGC